MDFSQFTPDVVVTAKATVLAAEVMGAGIALVANLGPGIGEGIVGGNAVNAIGRQPEAAGLITRTMIIADAICETSGIYPLIFALLVMFTRPFSSQIVLG